MMPGDLKGLSRETISGQWGARVETSSPLYQTSSWSPLSRFRICLAGLLMATAIRRPNNGDQARSSSAYPLVRATLGRVWLQGIRSMLPAGAKMWRVDSASADQGCG